MSPRLAVAMAALERGALDAGLPAEWQILTREHRARQLRLSTVLLRRLRLLGFDVVERKVTKVRRRKAGR